MLNEYKSEIEKFISNLKLTLEYNRNKYNSIKDEDKESLKIKNELKQENERLLIQIDETKNLEEELEEYFNEINKANKKIKLIKETIMADEDDEDVLGSIDKLVESYNKKIEKFDKKIQNKMSILDRIKKYNNIDFKKNYDLKVVKEKKAPRKMELSKEQLDNINNAINNPRIFNRVAEAKGINVKSRSKSVIEAKKALRKEIFDKLVEEQKKQKGLIDVKQVLTDLYGVDFTDKKVTTNSKEERNTSNKKVEEEIFIPIDIDTMIDEALKGLYFTDKKDDNNYRRINYKCRESFKNRVHKGNGIKNVSGIVMGGIQTLGMFVVKKKAQISTTDEDRDNYDELRKRIESWDKKDLVRFVKAYKGNKALSKGTVRIFNTILIEVYNKYVNERVEEINKEIIDIHNKIYDAYDKLKNIDNKLQEGKLTVKEKKEVLNKKSEVIKDKAKLIGRYYELEEEGNRLFIGEGSHDIEQTGLALHHKGSKIGGRLAKGYDNDVDTQKLNNQDSKLSKDIIKALRRADDEEALRKFVEYQQSAIKNTEIKRTALGTRSVGRRYYDPLVKNLDYTPDTLVRDLLVTVTTILTVWNTARAIANSVANGKTIADYNHDVNFSNGKNKHTMDTVHQTVHDVVKTRGKIQKGIKAQAHSDILNGFNVRERNSMDMSGWNISSSVYHSADHANHSLMEQLGSDLARDLKHIENIARKGHAVDPNLFTQLAHKYNGSFSNAINDSLATAKSYAASHPSIELDSCLNSMTYLKHHVKDIANMGSVSLKNTYAVEALENLSVEKVNAISGISDNLRQVLIQTGITGTLIANSAIDGNRLSSKYAGYGYGNEAIRRIENSVNHFNNILDNKVEEKTNVSNSKSVVKEEGKVQKALAVSSTTVSKDKKSSINEKHRVKDSVRNAINGISEPIKFDDEYKIDKNESNNQLNNLKEMKKSMVSKKSKRASSANVADAVIELNELNRDSAFVNKHTGKKNFIYTFEDVNLVLPEGFYYNENGSITNKGNTIDDKYVEFKVVKFENSNTELLDIDRILNNKKGKVKKI